MITTPLPGDFTFDIGKFVPQVTFNSLSLLIRWCRLQDLHDSVCDHGSTIVRIGRTDAVPGVPLVRGGKALHLVCLLPFGDWAMKWRPASRAEFEVRNG